MRRRVLVSALTAAAITALAWLGALYAADNAACDALYQRTGLQNRDIIVIGIDQETIDVLGPVTGQRGAMAKVIETLNAVPEDRPAVIGIDLMYTGESLDAPEADRRLAEAAARWPNVVLAADARFGNEMELSERGVFTVREQSVLGFYPPYPALRDAAKIGHVNQMFDPDGIFRHALLWVDTPTDGRVDSFARVIYESWCAARQVQPNEMPKTSAGGFYYLPFSQGADGYSDGVSFLDLYEGTVDPYFYRGKIVLIGPYAAGMQDAFQTSLDHAVQMPGVVIQANAVEAFIKGFFPQEVGRAVQLELLFLLCFLMMLFLWDRKVLPSLLVWLGVGVAWVGLCVLCYSRFGLILHVLWIPAGVSVVLIASVALNYIRSRREERRITDTFGHYIDPAVRDQLLSRGAAALAPGGKTRNIAVLFVDVRGFTAMSEQLDAETVVEIVNRYLTLTTECVMRYHGTLDKFVGDCTMAIWNAPLEQEDPVYLACRAAMDMVHASAALDEELQRRYGQRVSFGIGVNWGPAVVGSIGAPKRLDYTAIGDTVNTAARLEANAPGRTILISRAVADQLGDRAGVTSLGDSVPLKGKAQGFEVLTLDRLD